MSVVEDKEDDKPCSVCGEPAFRQEIEGTGNRTFFAMQGMVINDISKREGEPLKQSLFFAVYVCSKCEHVDLYWPRTSDPEASAE